MNKKGFTLLELLVVISIIGIIIAIGTVAYSSAQKKGRDAKRSGDLKAMQNAMEQYYSVNGNYGSDTGCSTQLGASMDTIPTDPKNGSSYILTCQADGSGYEICVDLEGDGTWDGSNSDKCVSNLQ
jgi:prepilin-type N-terminal cleavage/methylation domain-containing protein